MINVTCGILMSPESLQQFMPVGAISTKSLTSVVALVLLATAGSFAPFRSSAQWVDITYYTPAGQGVGANTATLAQNVSDQPYSALPSPSLEIYVLRTDGTKKRSAMVRTSNEAVVREVYSCPLEYSGNIPDGTPHSLRFRFAGIANGHALSNAIVTASIEKDSFAAAVDVKKLVYESTLLSGGLRMGEISFGNTTNAISGSNGLVTVIVEPPEPIQLSISPTNGNQLHLAALIQPGASLIVYSLPTAERLNRWTADIVANMYVPVTLENFGRKQQVSLALEANENQRFLAAEVSTCRYYPGLLIDHHCR